MSNQPIRVVITCPMGHPERAKIDTLAEQLAATEGVEARVDEIATPGAMLLQEVRPEVLRFAHLMEARLREHDEDRGRTGWKNNNVVFFVERLLDEAKELAQAWDNALPKDFPAIARQAADVGNFAMMIADNLGALPVQEE